MQSGLSVLLAGKRLDKFMQTVIFTQIYRWCHLHSTMHTGLSVLFMQTNDGSELEFLKSLWGLGIEEE